jgi:hypothetical protein
MAVLVEALSVVIRRDAIKRKYPGGWPAFVSAAPRNKTFCADTELARVGFMHPDDVGAFVQALKTRGLQFLDEQERAVDVVVVDQREGPTTACPWLEFFHHPIPGGRIAAARLITGTDQTLQCPQDWEFEHSLSHQFEFHPSRRSDDLEFVGRESGTDMFRKRSTGEELFVGRTSHVDAADDERTSGLHNGLYREAIGLLEPFLVVHVKTGDDQPARSAPDKAKLTRVCELLQRVVELREENWNAWWVLGMARRFLGEREAAWRAFQRAYTIAPTQIEVGRNLVMESLALGYGQEAVEVATAMANLSPDDAGLLANRALALLIAGDVATASADVTRALALAPADSTTRNLQTLIKAVAAGRVIRPSKWPPAEQA